jgi:ankyrin repeat protein
MNNDHDLNILTLQLIDFLNGDNEDIDNAKTLLKNRNLNLADKLPSYNLSKPLHIVINNKNIDKDKKIDMIDFLLNHGANINGYDPAGNRPLHLAVMQNNIDLVLHLLSKNPKLEVKNINDQTPYDIAKEQNYQDIVNALEPGKQGKDTYAFLKGGRKKNNRSMFGSKRKNSILRKKPRKTIKRSIKRSIKRRK